jgi:hypothetical protein
MLQGINVPLSEKIRQRTRQTMTTFLFRKCTPAQKSGDADAAAI